MSLESTPPAIDDTVAAALATAMDAIITDLDVHNINLTKQDRQKATSVGDNRLPFMIDYYPNKNDYPNLKPGFMNETEAERHWVVAEVLRTIILKADRIAELVSDLKINSEHFAYQYASEGYKVVKNGVEHNVPGADTFHDLLKKHFEQSPSTPEDPTPDPPIE